MARRAARRRQPVLDARASPSRTPACSSTPRCRRCASRCAIEPPASGRSARSCSTCRSRSRRGGAPTTSAEKERLLELFGEPGRWGTTLRTLPWTRISQNVPGFTGETVVDLHVPCTYDFEVTAAKYLQALDDGEIPLEFLFSGTVMYMSEAGLLQMARISWEREAEYGLPVARVARDDGPLLPRQRLAAAVARDLRPPLRLPRAQHAAELGARPSTRCCAEEER